MALAARALMRTIKSVVVLSVLLATGGVAAADETQVTAAAPAPEYAIGVRVGGYGFRQAPTAQSDHTGWTGCRMNGIGLFGERTLGARFFVEGGLDAYFTDDTGTGFHDHDGPDMKPPWIDRVSGLASVAGGVRLWPGARVSPYLQLGVGLEATRIKVKAEDGSLIEDGLVLPFGFIGLGGDLRLGRVRLGMSLRIHAMGTIDQRDPLAPGQALEPEPELAAQGQFYAKFAL
jgi:hypothetical protein